MFDFEYFLSVAPKILPGLYYTFMIALFSFIIGLCFSFILASIRIYKIKILNHLVMFYVSFFRGTPLLVLLFVFYFGFPAAFESEFWGKIDAIYYALFAFSLYAGAYLCEVVRSGFLSVDKGQLEAAYSLGMSTLSAIRRIIVPQTFINALPNLCNFFIIQLKNTALAFTITVHDVMGLAEIESGRSSKFLEGYLMAAIIYWGSCIFFEFIFARFEKKINIFRKNYV